MPQAFIDRLDNLALVERCGAVRSLTRKARVIWAGSTAGDPHAEDSSALSIAMQVIPLAYTPPLDKNGIPLGPPFDSLTLIERSPSVAENDPGVVDVILKYEHVIDGHNQLLNPLVAGAGEVGGAFPSILYGKGRCSIVEKTTNFFYPNGDTSQPRQVIIVAHTYQNNDGRIAGYPFLTNFPKTVFQSGEISIPFPQGNFTLMGILQTADPWIIGNQFIARVNLSTWLEQPPYTWICSDVQWEIESISQSLYKFQFEFQNNIDTWNPTVVFKDQTTGVPPSDVQQATEYATVDGPPLPAKTIWGPGQGLALNPLTTTPTLQPAGMWNVGALQAVDFNQLFGSYFEGVAFPLVG